MNYKDARHNRTTTKIVFALVLLFALSACGNDKSFNSAAWLKGDARARGRMAEDLVNSKILLGQTVDDVQRLLGPPDTTYSTVLSYQINLGWIFKKPDTYGILVFLDEKRRVREVRMVD